MRLNNVIAITLALLSSSVMGDDNMFLDLHKDANVSSLGDRHYSASLGRFLTPDRAKISISEYTYMNGNLIVRSDPSGLGLFDKIGEFFSGGLRESDFPPTGDQVEATARKQARKDDAAKVKRERKGTSQGRVRGNKGGATNVSIIPDSSLGAAEETILVLAE
ncbi:hypothetical protein BJAS_P3417 [Bathymodiolus japonicus methanotrophic gill symbiont]|uniref:hypothetical protein n=1 Tax=Bathymodiolus japonicus methanotrophic gill symbiont TaxID=113269 RepID=UPI001B49AD9A|nr:hypothetical protein [Bathymodiolus japonicus methanotrophic gill symbiont]GFO72881.1 hypothetical protein BJAS_P3417 [Bathymodiolus japonicus methanotrophic gill symbiont]